MTPYLDTVEVHSVSRLGPHMLQFPVSIPERPAADQCQYHPRCNEGQRSGASWIQKTGVQPPEIRRVPAYELGLQQGLTVRHVGRGRRGRQL